MEDNQIRVLILIIDGGGNGETAPWIDSVTGTMVNFTNHQILWCSANAISYLLLYCVEPTRASVLPNFIASEVCEGAALVVVASTTRFLSRIQVSGRCSSTHTISQSLVDDPNISIILDIVSNNQYNNGVYYNVRGPSTPLLSSIFLRKYYYMENMHCPQKSFFHPMIQ